MNMSMIGKTMAALRKSNGYTQETLAQKVGVSAQAVSKWETGAGLPEASLLMEISALFGVSIDDILRPGQQRDRVAQFMQRNLAAPCQKTLQYIPRIDRWNPPAGCDMYYSLPAMIAEALCCVAAQEKGLPDAVTMTQMNERFYELLHIMGVGYGFAWRQERNMIEELWRINDLQDMASRAMRYYGRDYLWLTTADTTADEMRRLIIWSIDKGRPVVMEWAGGIPEFSIVTGYQDNGDTLVGWTYCGECAAKNNELGMFVNPARWTEKFEFHLLVIGDPVETTYTDRDSITYALEVLDRQEAQNKDVVTMIAGDEAYRRWLRACDTAEHCRDLFTISDIFTHALYMNSIYTQKCILFYYKQLAASHDRRVSDVVNQLSIAYNRIGNERNGLESQKENPEAYAEACRRHIENLIQHKVYLRGWLHQLLELL